MVRKRKSKSTTVVHKPVCYYCEREFEDEKVLMLHQKAKHFKCRLCPRKLNTAGGLAVHVQQVHKLESEPLENTLPGRDGYDVEIFGMEGFPADVLKEYRARKEEEAGITPGSAPSAVKKQRISYAAIPEADLLRQLAIHKNLMLGLPPPGAIPPPPPPPTMMPMMGGGPPGGYGSGGGFPGGGPGGFQGGGYGGPPPMGGFPGGPPMPPPTFRPPGQGGFNGMPPPTMGMPPPPGMGMPPMPPPSFRPPPGFPAPPPGWRPGMPIPGMPLPPPGMFPNPPPPTLQPAGSPPGALAATATPSPGPPQPPIGTPAP